ncbi:MAG TPA: wyosine base formation domain-containing protein, partial [Streptosporangiaceae bacterium]|nr:wyosine base formation domain-containing protein [Streptosporangiaceae bacterium]
WTWGPDGAIDRVAGTALDFCLAVTQRRNLADTGLVVTGPVADQWMSIAQAFAGPAGPGRPPARERD